MSKQNLTGCIVGMQLFVCYVYTSSKNKNNLLYMKASRYSDKYANICCLCAMVIYMLFTRSIFMIRKSREI